jgi:hypothetical protein
MTSVPPAFETPDEPDPSGPELVLPLDEGFSPRGDRLCLSAEGVLIEHSRVMRAPLELPLGAIKVAAVDPGPAKAAGQVGRFAVLRRIGPTTVIPRARGIEGWLWTPNGGTGLTNLGEDDEAPNVALVLTKPLDERSLRTAFDPAFVRTLAARSPLGNPTVVGLVFRVADTSAAEHGFRRWGFQWVLTDREVPPTLRRHLLTDRPADPALRASDLEDARAATSVAPPGMS